MHSLVINDSLAFRSSKERQRTERRALAGDEEAALRLGEYTFLVEENLSAATYWYRVAAAHGSQRGRANLASLNRIDTKEWDAAHRKARKD
jgi:TPR repeat protein